MALCDYHWLIGQQQIQKTTSSNDHLNKRVECAELKNVLKSLKEREMLQKTEEEGQFKENGWVKM